MKKLPLSGEYIFKFEEMAKNGDVIVETRYCM